MIQDVKSYIAPYVALSNPVPYKDLLIYPITLSQYYEFNINKDILLIEKNKIPDINVIQMSYLKYIIIKLLSDTTSIDNSFFKTKGELYAVTFFSLLMMVFHVELQDIVVDTYKYTLKIKNVEISAAEFDEVKKIILYQNLIDYDDTPMSDDYRKAITEYYALKNKGIIAPSLEDKINVVIANTAYTEDSIKQMTYRRFCGVFNMIVDKTDYVVGSNGYSRKEPPEHWVYKTHKDKYSEVFGSDKFNELQK